VEGWDLAQFSSCGHNNQGKSQPFNLAHELLYEPRMGKYGMNYFGGKRAQIVRRPFWLRDDVAWIPQTWSCSQCEWQGEDPRYFRDYHQGGALIRRDPIPHPTCPECGDHRFYLFDV
jgi:hypothetical protein